MPASISPCRDRNTTFIYALTDPRPGDLHVYIGKADDPRKRLIKHLSNAKNGGTTYRANWIRSLGKLGLTPVLEIIKEVPIIVWDLWEMEFIRWYRVLGWRVVNSTDGGEGVKNLSDEARAKIGLASKGRKFSPESIAKMSVASRERMRGPLPVETRNKISAANKGKIRSEEMRRRIGRAHVGIRHTAEARAKIGAAFKGRKFSPESIAKMSAAAKIRESRRKYNLAGQLVFHLKESA